MRDSDLFKLGALLFALSGAVNIIADLVPGTAWFNLAGVAAGILGLPALYLVQRRAIGLPGLVAALLAGLGLIGIAGFLFADAAIFPALAEDTVAAITEGGAGLAIFAAVILYVLGVLAFAAASWRGAVLPRAGLALWAVGTAPTVAAIALPPVVMTVAEIVAGAGVVWLAQAVWRRAEREAHSTDGAGA